MTAPLLEVRGITVTFGGLTAVDDLSFQVRKGTVHALIGPNGAGKSTVFNCISRYYRPARGSILLDGQDILGIRGDRMARLGVARTFQNLELFAELSVYENVLLGCYAHSASTIGRIASPPPKRISQVNSLLCSTEPTSHAR